MNLLMVSSDASVAEGLQGAFHAMLAEFSRHWDRIDVLCPRVRKLAVPVAHGNVHFYPSPMGKAAMPFHILEAGRRLAKERRYGLLVSHDYGMQLNGIGSLMLSKFASIPYVSEIHHVEGYPIAVSLRERAMRMATMLYLKAARSRACAIRVVNREESHEIMRRAGVPERMLLLLPSFYIDFETFRPAAVPKRWHLAFCGRFSSNKGIFTILEAAARLKPSRPDLRVLLKGRGPLETAIRLRIARLGLDGNVEIMGWVPTAKDTALLFNQSRVLVCASTCEGGPRVTLEAMACGIPVVSTPVGVMRDLVEDGRNGLLFRWDADELARKAESLLSDPAMLAGVGEAGRLSVQHFEYRKIIGEYASGYRALAARASGGATVPTAPGGAASASGEVDRMRAESPSREP